MRTTPVVRGVRPAVLPVRLPGSLPAGLPAIVPLRQFPATRPRQQTAPPHHEAGRLFRRIRQIAGLSAAETARRLHTSFGVIDALEHGELDRLPPWPETVVVVSGFTALAGIDPRPVLAAIRVGLDAKIIDAQVSEVPAARPASPKAIASRRPRPDGPAPRWAALRQTVDAGQTQARRVTQSGVKVLAATLTPVMERAASLAGRGRLSRPLRMPLALCLAVTLPLALAVSFGSSNTLQAAVSSLPRPVAGVFRSVEDYVLRSMATEKNGLVWIEVSDPRSRKTDKLPSPRR